MCDIITLNVTIVIKVILKNVLIHNLNGSNKKFESFLILSKSIIIRSCFKLMKLISTKQLNLLTIK